MPLFGHEAGLGRPLSQRWAGGQADGGENRPLVKHQATASPPRHPEGQEWGTVLDGRAWTVETPRVAARVDLPSGQGTAPPITPEARPRMAGTGGQLFPSRQLSR